MMWLLLLSLLFFYSVCAGHCRDTIVANCKATLKYFKPTVTYVAHKVKYSPLEDHLRTHMHGQHDLRLCNKNAKQSVTCKALIANHASALQS